jgi:hypothetical protein
MIHFLNLYFSRDVAYGFDVLCISAEEKDRSLLGLIYDVHGIRLFINVLFIQWRIRL